MGKIMKSYNLLGVESGLEGLENLNLNLGRELLLLSGTGGGSTLGLGQVVTDSLYNRLSKG